MCYPLEFTKSGIQQKSALSIVRKGMFKTIAILSIWPQCENETKDSVKVQTHVKC